MKLTDCDALLIGCGASKLDHRARARELYTSTFFKEKVRFAEHLGLPWAILSAKHGILKPDSLTEPYDFSAPHLDRFELREWVVGVAAQLFEWEEEEDDHPEVIISMREINRLVLIAGETYASALTDTLRTLGIEVINPVAGLGIGQQIAWLREYQITTIQ